jgi:hypothetical protein
MTRVKGRRSRSTRPRPPSARQGHGAIKLDQIARFFDGLELLDPGFVSVADWWPEDQRDAGAATAMAGSGYVGIGRKP